MKRRMLLPVGIGLIALGAAGDHLLAGGSPTDAAGTVNPPANHAATPAVTNIPLNSSSAATAGSSAATAAAAINAATENAYNVAVQSVVYVNSVNVGTGSGIIYDQRGDIVTNDHVISGAKTIKVTLNSGATYTAAVVGTDVADDLAVIHINAPNLVPATFATADQIHVADTVLAIGSPLGLKQSVTSGMISGLNRVQQEPDGAYLPNAVQTSAPINPGNSGGALVNLNGTIVGMPTLEQTSTGEGTNAQNVGFAIPSTRITDVANQIISTGKVAHTGRAYLGIAPSDPSSAQSNGGFGLGGGYGFGPFGGVGQGGTPTVVQGAVVSQVSAGGPAAKAGIQQSDVITAANGQTITDAQDLLNVLAQEKPGDSLAVTINRDGQTVHTTVTLGELPAS